jgi:hypothetical protein
MTRHRYPRRVTPDDIDKHGWSCEGCGADFAPGDVGYSQLVGVSREGILIFGEFRCADCEEAKTDGR